MVRTSAKKSQETGTPRRDLYLVSDSSGNLLTHMATALLSQFPDETFHVTTVPFVASVDDLPSGLGPDDTVLHAVISLDLKAAIHDACLASGTPCYDALGHVANFLAESSGQRTEAHPERLHSLDASYMGRMSALEFAMQHDDNRRLSHLSEAEIILVGISRVSKSPTSLFLAYRGFKVANVAIVPSEGLPPELRRHRRKNVVALTIEARRLVEIRQRRFADWHLGDDFDYGDTRSVIHEVRDAEELYAAKKWPILNTTNLAVEESGTRVLQLLKMKPKEFG